MVLDSVLMFIKQLTRIRLALCTTCLWEDLPEGNDRTCTSKLGDRGWMVSSGWQWEEWGQEVLCLSWRMWRLSALELLLCGVFTSINQMWCKYVSKYGIRDISAIVNESVDVTHRLIYKHCGHPEHPAPAFERSSNYLCSRVENTLCHKRRIHCSFPIMRVLTHIQIHTEHIWDSQLFLHVFHMQCL